MNGAVCERPELIALTQDKLELENTHTMVVDLCAALATRHPNRSVDAIRQCRTKNRSYRDALAEVRLERLRPTNQQALIIEETGKMPEPGHASLHGNPVLNAQHCNTSIKWLNGKVTHNIGVFLEQNDPQNIVDLPCQSCESAS